MIRSAETRSQERRASRGEETGSAEAREIDRRDAARHEHGCESEYRSGKTDMVDTRLLVHDERVQGEGGVKENVAR